MTTAMRPAEDPHWHSLLGVDAVLRAQGADPVRTRLRSPRLVALAERALHEGIPLLAPALIRRQYTLLSRRHASVRFREGGRLSGLLVATECAPAEELVVMGITIGAALEKAAALAVGREPGFGLALDGLGTAAVEALAATEAGRIAAMANATGSCAGPPLSPGMEGWPLQLGQWEVFRLLGEGPHPIRLTESGMMVPRKSLTLIIGLGPAMRSEACTCDFCTSRDRCRHRQVR